MPSLDTLEQLADARFVALVLAIAACIALAWTCRRLYRDKCRAEKRLSELSRKVAQLVERIYERYVEDLRGRPRHRPEPPTPEVPEQVQRPDA